MSGEEEEWGEKGRVKNAEGRSKREAGHGLCDI